MTTIKTLQKPQIIEITGATIRIAHPDISGNIVTQLASPILASGTAMSVYDNHRFADDDWFIVGDLGDAETEECDVNGAVTRGKSITVTNTLKFDHEVNAPVTKIFERGIKIYGAATDGGAGTLIASVDAIVAGTNQLADSVMIQWNRPYTEYSLISTDTTYAYYFVKFTDGTTDSSASDYVLAAGLNTSSVEYFIQQALRLTDTTINDDVLKSDLLKWANDCQTAITQFTYQDPVTREFMGVDWDFEITEDVTTLATTENENVYSISSLNFKYPNSDKSVITARLGDKKPLKKISIDDLDDIMEGVRRTELSVASSVGGTTLTVDSNVEFNDSGTLYLGADVLTYTGKSGTTGFTGIPASGTGSITAISAIDAPVWQNMSPGEPLRWVIFNGDLILDRAIHSDLAGYIIKLRFYKKLTALTEASDVTEVNFTNVFQYYIASMIERRRGDIAKADDYMKEFKTMVLHNAIRNSSAVGDEMQYYTYDNFLDDYQRDFRTHNT